MKNMKTIVAGSLGLALVVSGAAYAGAQDAVPDSKYVSKEDFLKLQRENEQLKKEMEEMRAFKAQMQQIMQQNPSVITGYSTSGAPVTVIGTTAATPAAPDAKTLAEVKEMAAYTFPGSTKFLLTGYGDAGFASLRHSDPVFGAQFNPIFLWKLSDRLLFEGELEFELDGSETSTALEIANLSYILNDYMTIGAGKFLNPMNSFVERYHMAWVNRLPDKPLAVYDGLLPETYVGAQVRGALPAGLTKLNYAAFIGNAPSLITSAAPDDLASLGTMEWNNYGNEGGRVTVGGHVGWLPVPELEIGYGVHYSGLGGSDQDAFLQSVDLNYVRDSPLLRGLIRFDAQWVWSHLGRGAYQIDGTPGSSIAFNNNRDGGYVQLAYRPTKAGLDLLRHLEPVVRYDVLNQAHTPVGYDEQRLTCGLNYWLTPMTVFKIAYEFDNRSHHEPDASGVLLQFATGF